MSCTCLCSVRCTSFCVTQLRNLLPLVMRKKPGGANVGSLHLGRIPNCSEVPDIDVCRRVPTSGRGVVPRVPTCGGRLRSRAPTCGLPHTNTTSGWVPSSRRWLPFKCHSIVSLTTERTMGWSEFLFVFFNKRCSPGLSNGPLAGAGLSATPR